MRNFSLFRFRSLYFGIGSAYAGQRVSSGLSCLGDGCYALLRNCELAGPALATDEHSLSRRETAGVWVRRAIISTATDTAISSRVLEPMSSPIGDIRRLMCSSVTPASLSRS